VRSLPATLRRLAGPRRNRAIAAAVAGAAAIAVVITAFGPSAAAPAAPTSGGDIRVDERANRDLARPTPPSTPTTSPTRAATPTPPATTTPAKPPAPVVKPTTPTRAATPKKTATKPAVPAAGCSAYHGVQLTACNLLPSFGFATSEMAALIPMWNNESGWDYTAYNSGSGAFGIPQALPGSKMASAGSDWQTNPATQIKWGLGYIRSTYGSPSAAWSFWQANGWY
jgi:hypothetical protein